MTYFLRVWVILMVMFYFILRALAPDIANALAAEAAYYLLGLK